MNINVRFFSTTHAILAKKVAKSQQSVKKYFGRPSNHLSVGLVGLANVGKTTLFQAITNSDIGNAANYPFATIKPEELLVPVYSPRLDFLQKLYGSKKQLRGMLSVCDIAGLTRNASQGKGLGNQFLNDIRQVDGILQVVRGFRDSAITHIESSIDPIRDLEIVNDELVTKDFEFVQSGIDTLEKKVQHNKNDSEVRVMKQDLAALQKAQDILLDGKRIARCEWTNDEIDSLNKYNLLTAKPVVYLLNVSEEDYLSGTNEFLESVEKWAGENSSSDKVMLFSARSESKIKQGEVAQSAVPKIIQEMKNSLNLISFFTCGEKEAREWPLRRNSTAPEAAGIIHTDLRDTFISAEVIKYSDLETMVPESMGKLKSTGKVHREGKSYVIEDGDVLNIKAGKGKAR